MMRGVRESWPKRGLFKSASNKSVPDQTCALATRSKEAEVEAVRNLELAIKMFSKVLVASDGWSAATDPNAQSNEASGCCSSSRTCANQRVRRKPNPVVQMYGGARRDKITKCAGSADSPRHFPVLPGRLTSRPTHACYAWQAHDIIWQLNSPATTVRFPSGSCADDFPLSKAC